jgi:hypothetical protein
VQPKTLSSLLSSSIVRLLARKKARQPCVVHRYHRPPPYRTVQHHIWPKAEGGPTVPENLVWVCDTGHYNVHAAIDQIRAGVEKPDGTRTEVKLAQLGHARSRLGYLGP